MFRSPRPSGRVRRYLTITTLLCSVVLAVPAAAQTPTEAPSEAPLATVSESVTGLDLLVVTAAGHGLVLTVTDAGGTVASWTLDPATATDAGVYAVDLSAPDEGTAPANGTAAVVLTATGTEVLSTSVLLDRDPAAPLLGATASPRAATLVWSAVAGPGAVTYRVERATASGGWSVLADGLAATSYRDAGLVPGRHRYRLTAAVPAAGEGVNRSAPALAGVRIAAVAPPPEPEPEPKLDSTGTDALPFPRTPATLPELATPVPARAVAAAGDIRGGVAEPRRRRTAQRIAFANRPGLATLLHGPVTAFAPRIAENAPSPVIPRAAEAAEPRALPVPVGSSGMLVVKAPSTLGATQLRDVGTLLAVVLLGVAWGGFRRRRKDLA